MTTKEQTFVQKNSSQSAVIANGATTSGIVDSAGMSLIGIVTPSAFDGTTITLLASVDGTNFSPVYNSTTGQISITVSTSESRFISFTPSDFVAFRFFKLVAGSSQTAQRTITCVLRAL